MSNEMIRSMLHGRPPTPDQVQTWVHQLSASAFRLNIGDVDVDQRPLTIDATISVSRAVVETACCVPHAINPIIRQTFNGLFESMEHACWKLPTGDWPHPRTGKH